MYSSLPKTELFKSVPLFSLAAGQVHKMVKFVNSLSRLWGEGGQRPGEGSAANGDAALGGLRSLATVSPTLPPVTGKAHDERGGGALDRSCNSRKITVVSVSEAFSGTQGEQEDIIRQAGGNLRVLRSQRLFSDG